MDIRNKKIAEGDFMALRQEILGQWPTGKDVNLQEAVDYHKSMPECRNFGKKLLDAKRDGRTLVYQLPTASNETTNGMGR